MMSSGSQGNQTAVQVSSAASSMAQGVAGAQQQQAQQAQQHQQHQQHQHHQHQQQAVNPHAQQQLHLQQTTTTTAIHGTPQQQQHHHAAGPGNPMQQLQVIQSPLQSQYLQQLYQGPGGQLLMNGNIQLHPGINPPIQLIAAGKTFQPNQLGGQQMLTAATSYTAIPTTAANNQQAYIIGQLINSQGGLIQQHQQPGKPGEMPKVLSPQISAPLQQGLWASPHIFAGGNQIFIRGAQQDQMFIQQQQPLHTNTSTNQHFSMQSIAATAQLPATSISAGTPNSIQASAQQQASVQQTQNQQQQNQQLAPQPIQPQPQNVVTVKAPATLQPKPPLQIQPQPTQNQQHHSIPQQIQQVTMTHTPHQLQIIPQPATSQTNVISAQPVMAAPPGQTITMQANPTQAQLQTSQAPRQLTILPQQQPQQTLQAQVSHMQQHTASNQPQIRPNYTIVTQGTASVPVSQVQVTATSAMPTTQTRPKAKKMVGRSPAPTPNTPQLTNKTVFPRPTQLPASSTVTPISTQLSNGAITLFCSQAKPSTTLVSQQPAGATLTKVQIPTQTSSPSQPMVQPLKTINMSALHSPPNLPDATLTPLIPQSNAHGVSTGNNQVSQPVQVYSTATQLPSPNISITPAPPPQQPPAQLQTSGNNKKEESTEMGQSDNKVETEKENTNKTNADDSEDPSVKHSKLPKAMVKPQVLTHVLGGFVIQESVEPFPPPRNGEIDEPPKKKAALSPGGEMAKCEMCSKVDLKAKFKKNKRFCSSACAKSSKTAATQHQQQNQQQQVQANNNSLPNGTSTPNKDKLGQKRKWGDGEAELTDETSSSTGETSSLSPTEDQNDEEPKINPVKWTVSEVVDFVKNLPGCAEYAEDFAVQEIDGQALMLLKEDHLMSAIGMKLGPALKLCAKIEVIRSATSGGSNAEAPSNKA